MRENKTKDMRGRYGIESNRERDKRGKGRGGVGGGERIYDL